MKVKSIGQDSLFETISVVHLMVRVLVVLNVLFIVCCKYRRIKSLAESCQEALSTSYCGGRILHLFGLPVESNKERG